MAVPEHVLPWFYCVESTESKPLELDGIPNLQLLDPHFGNSGDFVVIGHDDLDFSEFRFLFRWQPMHDALAVLAVLLYAARIENEFLTFLAEVQAVHQAVEFAGFDGMCVRRSEQETLMREERASAMVFVRMQIQFNVLLRCAGDGDFNGIDNAEESFRIRIEDFAVERGDLLPINVGLRWR